MENMAASALPAGAETTSAMDAETREEYEGPYLPWPC